VVYSMLIDDIRDGMGNRSQAREFLDEQLAKPLMSVELSDAQVLAEYEDQLRETWGTSQEAQADQNSSFWDN
jgi:hypothetical protein